MKINSIIHGDAYKEVPRIIREVSNPIIVTDPPFNLGYHYEEYKDNKSDEDYYGDLAGILKLCPSVVIHYPEALYRIASATGVFPTRVVSWAYNSNTPRQHRDIAYFGVQPDFTGLGVYKNPTDKRIAERIAQGKKPKGYDWLYCDQIKNVGNEKLDHPCQMPMEVMNYVIATIPKDATVIDPFTGSGTTLLAAKRLGLKYMGVEMTEKYVKMARSRLLNDSPLFD